MLLVEHNTTKWEKVDEMTSHFKFKANEQIEKYKVKRIIKVQSMPKNLQKIIYFGFIICFCRKIGLKKKIFKNLL